MPLFALSLLYTTTAINSRALSLKSTLPRATKTFVFPWLSRSVTSGPIAGPRFTGKVRRRRLLLMDFQG
jgi:hypothetical protein